MVLEPLGKLGLRDCGQLPWITEAVGGRDNMVDVGTRNTAVRGR